MISELEEEKCYNVAKQEKGETLSYVNNELIKRVVRKQGMKKTQRPECIATVPGKKHMIKITALWIKR